MFSDKTLNYNCAKRVQDFSVWLDSVWPIRSGRFGLAVSVWAVSVWAVSVRPIQSGRFGLAVSVTGHFGRDVSVHKELMKFVNVNGYLGRKIIFLYNTIQIKTW